MKKFWIDIGYGTGTLDLMIAWQTSSNYTQSYEKGIKMRTGSAPYTFLAYFFL